ncbi:MAG TPA: hypothetical protein VGH08_00690 [Chthoniobacterales bacterium]
MKIARPIGASKLLAGLPLRRLVLLVSIVVSANAHAVLRPPFPTRARPPSGGRWAVIGNDSISAWPHANTDGWTIFAPELSLTEKFAKRNELLAAMNVPYLAPGFEEREESKSAQ